MLVTSVVKFIAESNFDNDLSIWNRTMLSIKSGAHDLWEWLGEHHILYDAHGNKGEFTKKLMAVNLIEKLYTTL